MKICIISDTHIGGRGKLSDIVVPDADMLIHCGDHTWTGVYEEVVQALDWFSALPHKYKIAIAGNHDFLFDERFADGHVFRGWTIKRPESINDLLAKYPGIIYLQDSSVEIEGLKIYGSPWQPFFYNWAFNFDGETRGFIYPVSIDTEKGLQQAKNTWEKIPDDTNILVTHCPPAGILDHSTDGHRLGDRILANRFSRLNSLKLHCFGHIHEGYGHTTMKDFNNGNIVHFINAAICNGSYYPVNKPIVIDLAMLRDAGIEATIYSDLGQSEPSYW